MNNYITIISRSDFSNLYKFGHLFVHNLVPFAGSLKEHDNDRNLFDAVTAYLDTYQYSTEYLLLHIRKMVFIGITAEIFVKDIAGIFALSQDAKNSLTASLDSRINIQVSRWEPFFEELNKKQTIRQAKAGKYNCFEIFQITDLERAKVDKIIPQNFVEELYNDLYNHIRPTQDSSIWNYLVRYERHFPYWNDNRGFFSDAVHVFESFLQSREIDYEIADEVPAGDIIGHCVDSFSRILQKLNDNEITGKYHVNGCTYFVVAPLYLYLKALFKDGGITASKYYANQKLFSDLHNKYDIDFAVAIYLLGVTLGHDLTYSFYYQYKNLQIFNNYEEEIPTTQRNKGLVDPTTGKVINDNEAQELINTLSNEVVSLKQEQISLATKNSDLHSVNNSEDIQIVNIKPDDIDEHQKSDGPLNVEDDLVVNDKAL